MLIRILSSRCHCEPPVQSGAKQSHLLSVCFFRKHLARNRLRNLTAKDEIATLPSVARNDIRMTLISAIKY